MIRSDDLARYDEAIADHTDDRLATARWSMLREVLQDRRGWWFDGPLPTDERFFRRGPAWCLGRGRRERLVVTVGRDLTFWAEVVATGERTHCDSVADLEGWLDQAEPARRRTYLNI